MNGITTTEKITNSHEASQNQGLAEYTVIDPNSGSIPGSNMLECLATNAQITPIPNKINGTKLIRRQTSQARVNTTGRKSTAKTKAKNPLTITPKTPERITLIGSA